MKFRALMGTARKHRPDSRAADDERWSYAEA
jgi:hypothetical protein